MAGIGEPESVEKGNNGEIWSGKMRGKMAESVVTGSIAGSGMVGLVGGRTDVEAVEARGWKIGADNCGWVSVKKEAMALNRP